jgi:leucyl/phenylalanyl-tRNA--protein transferase
LDVIRGCADPTREKGWITEDFIAAYKRLHDLGWAHSIEVFGGDGQLAGGLYGVRVNGLFAGESMFHRQRDASKVALMALVDLMLERQMMLLDVQWKTEHLESLGAIEIPRREYLVLLEQALRTSG